MVLGGGLPTDQHPKLADIHEAHALLTNTTKPILTWGNNVQSLQEIIDMCSVIAGSFEDFQSNPFVAILFRIGPTSKTSSRVIGQVATY